MEKRAFTLAEVLITLTIIGVIAAITIPNLYSKYQKHVWATQAKEAYSILSAATSTVNRDFDDLTQFIDNSRSVIYNNEVAQAYAEALNVQKVCGTTTSSSSKNRCTNQYDYYPQTLDGSNKNTPTAADALFCTGYHTILKNNMMLSIHPRAFGGSRYWALNGLGNGTAKYLFTVDVNGLAKPNIFGRDIFSFVLQEDGRPVIQPLYYKDKNDCNTTNGTGYDCAYHLFKNGWKMDY